MMKKLRKIGLLMMLLCGIGFLVPAHAAAPDPMIMLHQVTDDLLAALKANRPKLRQNPDYIYDLVDKLLLPHVDKVGMSRSVLGRNAWMKASASEKKQFTSAFIHVIVRTYAGALNAYTDETVKFYPIRGGFQGKRTITVSSDILRDDGPAIPVVYSLALLKNEWKVYDLNVEGVGLLQSFHSQISDLLNQGQTIDQIIEAIKKPKNGNGH